jgi:hypothetical protein
MIEKLEKQNTWGECLEKLNELIDAVNRILDYAPLEMAMKAEPETPADPYAEQRKWIGKLCKFWDYDGEEKWFSILEHIDKNSPYTYCASGDWWYKHCELVKPDDDIIYKGE